VDGSRTRARSRLAAARLPTARPGNCEAWWRARRAGECRAPCGGSPGATRRSPGASRPRCRRRCGSAAACSPGRQRRCSGAGAARGCAGSRRACGRRCGSRPCWARAPSGAAGYRWTSHNRSGRRGRRTRPDRSSSTLLRARWSRRRRPLRRPRTRLPGPRAAATRAHEPPPVPSRFEPCGRGIDTRIGPGRTTVATVTARNLRSSRKISRASRAGRIRDPDRRGSGAPEGAGAHHREPRRPCRPRG
jgi:hypothetical protein